jgi:dTDP-4-dehydrorhamnose reductase
MGPPKKIAVVGALGMLGRELCRQLASAGSPASALDLAEVDIRSESSVARCRPLVEAQVIFNCAAYTNVEKAEEEPEEAMRVNGQGVGHLARLARASQALLVHLSTDFVFDGTRGTPYPVDAERHPLSAYARSKLAGELALEEAGGRTVLVRTAWLYGQGGKNFVDSVLRLAREKGELAVVDDQVGSPTFAADLAQALIELVQTGKTGVFHCTNRGQASWCELAREAVRLAGIAVPVRPLTTVEATARFGLKARRPAYSVLDLTPLETALGRPMRPWQTALGDYLNSQRR